MSDPVAGQRRMLWAAWTVAAGIAVGSPRASWAEQPYPFEGTWVRADRVCAPSAPSARTYTGRELIRPNGRCSLRKVVFGSGEWELFEECRREPDGDLVERIRMYGPDSMAVRSQVNRLKIARGRRFTRCTPAAARLPQPASPGHSPAAAPGAPRPEPEKPGK